MSDSTRSRILEVMAEGAYAYATGGMAWDTATDITKDKMRELVGSSLAALSAEGMAVVPGWQPIESAPKDGSEILGCYFKDWGDGCVSRYGPWTIAWDGRDWRSSWDGSQVIEYMGDFGTEYKEPDLKPNFWMPVPLASPYGKASMQEASAEREARSEQIPPGKEESK